jgi:hypothetical protein
MEQKLLDIYTDYLISQNQYATATSLSLLLDEEISHDKITRFLNKSEFGPKELWSYVKKYVRQYEQEEAGVLIIDDTIEEKPYTDENKIVSWHYSHSKGSQVKGINLLSCLIRYGDKAVPVTFDIISKDEDYHDPVTGKTKRRSSISKNERFRGLVNQALKNEVKFEYVLADSWFGSKENMTHIHYKVKKKFIFGLKTNRLVKLDNPEGGKGVYQDLDSINMQDNEKRIVWLKELSFAVAIVKKEFKNENGSKGTLYLVSNDLGKEGEIIYQVYQKRWRIEEYHKSIKENASLSKSPTKVECSQKNHIFAAIIAYCKLEFLSIKTCLNHFGLKYKLILRANQVAFQELQKLKAGLSFA